MVRRAASLVAAFTLAASILSSCSGAPSADERIHLNDVQVLGSHNSYHQKTPDELFAGLTSLEPDLARTLDYVHPPLDDQLDGGARQLEIDVFADPEGGLYATHHANPLVGLPAESDEPALREPGFKVLHVQDVDYASSCLTLVACLTTVKDWSDDHPDHLPIFILIEAKDDPIPDPVDAGFVTPVTIDATQLDALDAEIRSVFGTTDLITPDDVRGDRSTLREAVLEDGWPTLREARGKVMFGLDNEDDVRDAYLAKHPSLAKRVMFTSSDPDADSAAFVKLNDAVKDGKRITDLVAKGYLVRTCADADTEQSRSGDTSVRDAALASGAQYVSSDYLEPDPRFTDYVVRLPKGAVARCTPAGTNEECADADLEG